MITKDPGHVYLLEQLDQPEPSKTYYESLTFVKREGDNYPGNVGHHHGTTTQEVLRVLIDRAKYVDKQEPDEANVIVIYNCRDAILALEQRAARRHDRELNLNTLRSDIENEPTCPVCGHIQHGQEFHQGEKP